jgi:hypothetical protein
LNSAIGNSILDANNLKIAVLNSNTIYIYEKENITP